MSKYLDRLQKYYEESHTHKIGTSYKSRYIFNKQTPSSIEVTLKDVTFEEIEYKGYSLIILGLHNQYRDLFDKNGDLLTDYSPNDIDIAGKGEKQFKSRYYAYAYKIDNESEFTDLRWNKQGADIAGICASDSINKTRSQAIKKIELNFSIADQLPTLISIADDRWNGGFTCKDELTPYNAFVGDHVFIQAHGRLRKGVIVSTTGSRFVVGYVTPSNHRDLKYKILPLQLMHVLETV